MRVILRVVCLAVLCLMTGAAQAQTLTPADVSYVGYSRFWPDGYSSAYLRALTHRRVGGELRFLTLTHTHRLLEFRPVANGQATVQRAVVRTWDLAGLGVLSDHAGIWWEESRSRLWVTSAQDYPVGDAVRPARVSLVTLNDTGTASVIGTWTLQGIPEKRVYGGCQPSPLAAGRYVCGWGGYTSRVAQTGGASIGPTMYEIAEPTSQPSGSTLAVRTILDTCCTDTNRGYRLSSAVNWFDGGDTRQNPSTRPTFDPSTAGGPWKMPVNGHGWMTWGDSYYATGVVIPGRGYLAVASLCRGYCWYQSSTLAFDGRQFELHVWPTSALGLDILARPSMAALSLPDGRTDVFNGNVTVRNISGATYDAATSRLYLFGCPFGENNADWSCRVFQFAVAGAGAPPVPSPPPAPDPAPSPQPDPVPPPAPSPALPVGAVQCATEGQACTWATNDTRTVYYGAGALFAVRESTSPAICSNAAFGGDPAPGTLKWCYVVPPAPVPTPVPTPTPPPAPTVPLPVVTMTPTQCRLTLTAQVGPDGTSVGWSVQYTRNGANHGSADTSTPYERTATVGAGSYALAARWSKANVATVTQDLGTKVCP